MLLPAALAARCSISAFSDSTVWQSLKRMLKRARASPGMRLTVLLPTSTEVNSRFDGWKFSLPWSSGSDWSASISVDQAADRVHRALRIGDMALLAGDGEVAVERAAAADLDGVAELFLVARLGQDAMVELLAMFGGPLQQLGRAVDRDAFFVARDQERDRTLGLAVLLEMVEHGGDRAGDAALHVDRAAAVKLAVVDLGRERRMAPARLVARRHHVGVAGDDEIGRFRAKPRIEVFDVGGARLAEGHAVDGETGRLQRLFENAKRAAFRRRHRRTAQQVAGDGNGIGAH